MKKNTAIGSLTVGAALLISLAACDLGDKATQPWNDAPRLPGVNLSGMKVIAMADGFSNLGSKCDGYGNQVTVIYHGDGAYGHGWTTGYADLAPQNPCRYDFSSIPAAK